MTAHIRLSPVPPLRALPSLLLCLVLYLPLPTSAGGESQPLEHVVIIWLKEAGNPAIQNRIIAASQVLRSIPGVLSLRAGTAIASERPIVDSSFDVALVIRFTDQAALDNYLSHPLHLQLVEATLKPLVERILVYDFR